MVIKGKVKWCSVLSPNTTFEPVWCVDVIVDDADTESELKAAGLKVKKDKDGDKVIKFSRKTTKADGTPNKQPACVSKNPKVPFTELIGNGSVCNVQYSTYDWTNKFGSGVGADFKGIQVLEHIAYAAEDGGEFEAVDGEDDLAPKEAKDPNADGGEFDDDIPF